MKYSRQRTLDLLQLNHYLLSKVASQPATHTHTHNGAFANHRNAIEINGDKNSGMWLMISCNRGQWPDYLRELYATIWWWGRRKNPKLYLHYGARQLSISLHLKLNATIDSYYEEIIQKCIFLHFGAGSWRQPMVSSSLHLKTRKACKNVSSFWSQAAIHQVAS
jgi:hypothetical protein